MTAPKIYIMTCASTLYRKQKLAPSPFPILDSTLTLAMNKNQCDFVQVSLIPDTK